MPINIEDIKKLRDETGAGVIEGKKALDDVNGNLEEAKKALLSKAGAKAAKKADRTAGDGLIYSYIHGNGKVGSLVHIACETDFVAKTDDFKNLCKEIAMQVCAEDYESVEEALSSEYMRDASKTIQDVINEVIAKLGEKIELKRFTKFSVNN